MIDTKKYCQHCLAAEGERHKKDCIMLAGRSEVEEIWKEDRIDAIGQNGATGDHYPGAAKNRWLEKIKDAEDPGKHYRLEIRRRITDEDISRGWVRVKVDPYRICRLSGIQGGPHEHATKKLLRGKAKGHSERELIREVRACLDRWEEMLNEDEEEARCR